MRVNEKKKNIGRERKRDGQENQEGQMRMRL